MAFAYLSPATLDGVRTAVQALGLNTDGNLDALSAGINPAFVGFAMVGPNPNAKLVTMTSRLNVTRNLVSGEVPLAIWLRNAILLAGGSPEETVFRAALAEMSTDGESTPGAPADVGAAPRTSEGVLEIAIDEDDTLGVAFLLRGAAAASSVAKLTVHRHFDGAPAFVAGGKPDLGLGTGWMIGPGLLITNHHVIAARAPSEPAASDADFALQGAHTTALFDYHEPQSPGVPRPSTACVASDKALDYAVVRLAPPAPPAPSAPPTAERAPLRLRANPLTRPPGSALRERVNVLQHPLGEPMRLGFRNNFVVTGSAERLSYLTDTAGGSSGSPICDDLWFVAGLHRGWATIKGDPVSVWGKEIRQENYATPIALILADIAAKDPALRAEIDAGQLAGP